MSEINTSGQSPKNSDEDESLKKSDDIDRIINQLSKKMDGMPSKPGTVEVNSPVASVQDDTLVFSKNDQLHKSISPINAQHCEQPAYAKGKDEASFSKLEYTSKQIERLGNASGKIQTQLPEQRALISIENQMRELSANLDRVAPVLLGSSKLENRLNRIEQTIESSQNIILKSATKSAEAAADSAAKSALHSINLRLSELEANQERSALEINSEQPDLPNLLSKKKKAVLMAAGLLCMFAMALPIYEFTIRNQDSSYLAKPIHQVQTASKTQPVTAQNAGAENPTASPTLASRRKSADSVATISVSRHHESDSIPVLKKDIGNPELRAAVQRGDPSALYEVGRRYTEGFGVARNLAEAAKWYQYSAERGFGPAQFRLGHIYEKAQGVEMDIARAVTWYEKAAEQGNIKAMHNFAFFMATGIPGYAPEAKKAAIWFRVAAEHGIRDSQVNLGIFYSKGIGVDVDFVEAYKWFTLAAKAGDPAASSQSDQLAKSMRPEELEKGKAIIANWKPIPPNQAANKIVIPETWKTTGIGLGSSTSSNMIRAAQELLSKMGIDPGPSDGLMGEKTRNAIMLFQQRADLEVNGKLTTGVLNNIKRKSILD